VMQPATDLMMRFWQNIEKRKCVCLGEKNLGSPTNKDLTLTVWY
jgi:hypothetical protein